MKHTYHPNLLGSMNIVYSHVLLFSLTTKPSRVTDAGATLIDHVWTTQPGNNIANCTVYTSDNFSVVSQFLLNSNRQKHTYIHKGVSLM